MGAPPVLRDRRRWVTLQAAVAVFLIVVFYFQCFARRSAADLLADSVALASSTSGQRGSPAAAVPASSRNGGSLLDSGAACDSRPAALHSEPPPQGIQEVFATLWNLEQWFWFGMTNDGPLPNATAQYNLDKVLDSIKAQGVQIIFTSFWWDWHQPTPENKFEFRVLDYFQKTVCGKGLKLAVVLDGDKTPAWVAKRFPGGVFRDVLNETRGAATFNHPGALELVHNWHDAVLARLAENNAKCIHSIQPSFNNQYETKYTQERDAPQDYSPAAAVAFKQYVRQVHGGLAWWNKRWGQSFPSWEALEPPKFYQHGQHYNDTRTDPFYWDWQHFRHHQQHAALEGCCQRVAAHGFRCIMHFPEVFTSGDAIYGSGSVFTLAASPWLDYLIIDSNFVTVSRHPNDVRIVQILISAMKPFNKPVFFEGAFEELHDPALHRRAMELTVASGAYGMGFTNWLSRVNHTEFFRNTLSGLSQYVPAKRGPPVAILTPYRSYLAYKGAPLDPATNQLVKNDPQQDALFQCLDRLERALPALDGLQVFGMPAMLLPVLQQFEQVWYIEPDVLLSGDASTVSRVKQQAAALGVQMLDCVERKEPAIVVPECCPTM